jgi:hypothetical protein
MLEPFDANVSKTIVKIIEVFFQNIQNALIYICDDKDEKALLRHTIFDRWYKNSNNKNQIIKVDNVIRFNITAIESKTLYTSLLLSPHNQNFHDLIDIYNRMGEILNEDK